MQKMKEKTSAKNIAAKGSFALAFSVGSVLFSAHAGGGFATGNQANTYYVGLGWLGPISAVIAMLYKLRSYRRFAGAAAVGGHRRRAEQGIRSCVLLKGRHALAHAAHGQADKQDMHRPADRIRRRGSGIHKRKESVVRARPGDARHYYIDRHRLEHDEHG